MLHDGRQPTEGPEIKSIKGHSGTSYLVFRTRDGEFHVFRRVDAKKAAEDCGAMSERGGRQMWEKIWEAHPLPPR